MFICATAFVRVLCSRVYPFGQMHLHPVTVTYDLITSLVDIVQALFADPDVGKLLPAFASRQAYLKAAGADPAHQMAHLVALEHLTGMTLPDQVNEVSMCPLRSGAVMKWTAAVC